MQVLAQEQRLDIVPEKLEDYIPCVITTLNALAPVGGYYPTGKERTTQAWVNEYGVLMVDYPNPVFRNWGCRGQSVVELGMSIGEAIEAVRQRNAQNAALAEANYERLKPRYDAIAKIGESNGLSQDV